MMREALVQRVTSDVIAGLPGWRALTEKGASPEYQMTWYGGCKCRGCKAVMTHFSESQEVFDANR